MSLLALTILVSAFLLFQVQPLVGRFVLPWFGGGPAVWTTCMLFFQVTLLGGYAYAHLLSRLLRPRQQALCHLVVLLASLAALPLTVSAAWKPVDSSMAAGRILAMLAFSVGGPYFVLSATGPLLQSWFTRRMPQRAVYRLYGLSNAGSLLALLTYPLLFEPNLTRVAQASAWSVGYVVFVLGCSACAVTVWRNASAIEAQEAADVAAQDAAADLAAAPVAAPTWSVLLIWTALAALGSIMLLATTNQLCQDVAVVPFLWVLPLALYLLTFIICFDRPEWYSPGWCTLLLIVGGTGSAAALARNVSVGLPTQIAFLSLALFAGCMLCHGELVRRKPHPQFLTHFYLTVAAGGAAGGLFVALLAPVIFTSFWEYPIGLTACCLLAGVVSARDREWLFRRRWPESTLLLGTACLAIIVFFLGRVVLIDSGRVGHRLAAGRNFYGVLRVYQTQRDGNDFVEMHQGNVIHGSQFTDSARSAFPTMYYGRDSGVGIVLDRFPRPGGADATAASPGILALPALPGKGPLHVGVIGMGAGTLATYAHPGDRYRFYEINPQVETLARARFHFLDQHPAEVSVVLGDARIMLEREWDRGENQRFDVLIVDAFTGDAVPIHLLTRECGQLYAQHLKPDGLLALHISNHFLDLEPVARGLAQSLGRPAQIIESPGDAERHGTEPSVWVVITNNPQFLATLGLRRPHTQPQDRTLLWTDDFSSLWQVLRGPGK
ncbi:MAG: fused MFS/spermidine synthase [Planctomycetota bacterium]|nr:fused MFS/spermidine synthase [Planctomycetota bacterium]